jgi:hypothetical protein
VFAAMRAGDLDTAVTMFSEDCLISLPGESYEGREGVRAWRAARAAGTGPEVQAGEPEAIDEVHVLVPVTAEVSVGGETQPVKVTGVWTVVNGLIAEIRVVPGGRRMAIASLSAGS